MLNRLFHLDQHRTTPLREFQAGLTTFAAMAYILAVNPAILANAGMDKAALVTVTAVTAALATALMALLTNYPIALAPGMGINAFFTFTIVLGKGVPWTEALGMVFVNGVVFLALSLTGWREKIIAAIPHSLKLAITAGIGLFIAFIGLKNAGVIVANLARALPRHEDLLPYLPVDLQRFEAHIREVNPRCTVLPVSATSGDGLEAWYRWVLSSCAALRADPSPSVLVPA